MAITNATIAQQISNLIGYWDGFNTEYANWLGGSATGGPNSDGRYPLTDYQGITSLLDCPAKLAQSVNDNVSGSLAHKVAAEAAKVAAVAAEANAELAETNAEAAEVGAVSAKDIALAAQVAAESARSTAIAQASVATTKAGEAAASAAAALLSEGAAGDSAIAAAASEAAAAASAVLAATFDPANFYTRAAIHGVGILTNAGAFPPDLTADIDGGLYAITTTTANRPAGLSADRGGLLNMRRGGNPNLFQLAIDNAGDVFARGGDYATTMSAWNRLWHDGDFNIADYYTAASVDSLLSGKSDTGHAHAGVYAPLDADFERYTQRVAVPGGGAITEITDENGNSFTASDNHELLVRAYLPITGTNTGIIGRFYADGGAWVVQTFYASGGSSNHPRLGLTAGGLPGVGHYHASAYDVAVEIVKTNNMTTFGDYYALMSESKINEWNTAYGWGDHAAAGYAAASHSHNYFPRYTIDVTGGNLDTIDAPAENGWYAWTGTQPVTGSPGWSYGVALAVEDGAQMVQLAFGSSGSGRLAVRRNDSGSYYPWTEFWSEANFDPTSKSDIGHTHSYLPLAGGTATGDIKADSFGTLAAHGEGLRFWNGSTSYTIYMSARLSEPYGVTPLDLGGDYNMYFRMGGNTRGFVFYNLTSSPTAAAQITGDGDILSRGNVKPGENVVFPTGSDTRGIVFGTKLALSADGTDGWLRLNNNQDFTNGVYSPGDFQFNGAMKKYGGGHALYHDSSSHASGKVTASAAAPSGGANGDIHLQFV